MRFLKTFRGKLLAVLAIMLVATIGVQFYLNLLMQEENNELREAQMRAIVSGFAVGAYSMTGSERLEDILADPNQTFLDPSSAERIKDIIIIDNEWRISDSLNPDYLPILGPDGETIYRQLGELNDLPPLMEGSRLGGDIERFPNRREDGSKEVDDEAHAVPIETSQGRWYIMVLLRNDRSEAAARAAQPLLATLGVLSISTIVMVFLVWRFTKPIANLSAAARKVAEGELTVRVPDEGQHDEMGRLAGRFNEMTRELEKSKALAEQLQEAEKSAVIGRLGSAIAHEIRNPLNYINLTLDHLRSKYSPEDDRAPQFRKMLGQLKQEVARINQQISDFLNYSRPASVELRPTVLRDVVEDSLRLIEGQAEESGIKVALIERENVPRVLGDTETLRSVFNNLLINAMQSMGNEGGKLTVTIEPVTETDEVAVSIADTGNGISEENLSKIFEPYFSTKETGTGLGLAIVQKIVDVHNGRIEVESAEGEGTTFRLMLRSAENKEG